MKKLRDPADAYLLCFPAQHLLLYHGLWDEQFPRSDQLGCVRLVISISLPLPKLCCTMALALQLLVCSSLGLHHQVVMPEVSTSRCVTLSSASDGWMPGLGGAT